MVFFSYARRTVAACFFRYSPSHKYGDFTLECRYATDQVPLLIVVGLDKNWDEKDKKSIAVSQPGAGLEKIQC